MANPLVSHTICALYERIVKAAKDHQFIVNDLGSYACLRRIQPQEIEWLQNSGRKKIEDLDFVSHPKKVRQLRLFFRACGLEEDAATKGIPSPPAMRFLDCGGTPCDVFLRHHWYRPLSLRLTTPSDNEFPDLPISNLVVCKLIACRRNVELDEASDDVLDGIAIVSCDRFNDSAISEIAQLLASDWQLEQTVMLGIRRVQAVSRGLLGRVPERARLKLDSLLDIRNSVPVSRIWRLHAAISKVVPRWHHEQVPDPIV